ncbi:MAG: hypothetical protein BGO41_01390 [Clostridiales bacterium 38-18]|nr:MAG: hypothetical protein BGO41_01390 [Clostridiales bacterium 38-18]
MRNSDKINHIKLLLEDAKMFSIIYLGFEKKVKKTFIIETSKQFFLDNLTCLDLKSIVSDGESFVYCLGFSSAYYHDVVLKVDDVIQQSYLIEREKLKGLKAINPVARVQHTLKGGRHFIRNYFRKIATNTEHQYNVILLLMNIFSNFKYRFPVSISIEQVEKVLNMKYYKSPIFYSKLNHIMLNILILSIIFGSIVIVIFSNYLINKGV